MTLYINLQQQQQINTNLPINSCKQSLQQVTNNYQAAKQATDKQPTSHQPSNQ